MELRLACVVGGLIVVALTAVDELRTTVGVTSGAGWLSAVIYRGLWRAGGHGRSGRRATPARWAGGMGTAVVVTTITAWFALLWLGWTLVLLGSGPAVISTHTGRSASLGDRVFYAGTSLADLGNSSYRPLSLGYELAVVGEAACGLVLLTLAITFVSPVMSGVIGMRSFASQLHGLGEVPADMAACLYSAGEFGAAQQLLLGLSGQLATIAEQHRAYPLLVTFRARSRETAIAPAVALLLDLAIVLGEAAPEDCRLPASLLRTILSSVESYLSAAPTLGRQELAPPPVPDLGGGPACVAFPPERVSAAFGRFASLRTDALRHVLDDGWTWSG